MTKKNNAKEPRKAKIAIDHLQDLVGQLEYFYQNPEKFRKEVLKKAVYIEEILYELSVDKKIDHARFISRFKHLFAKENEELKEEVRELKEELKERGEKIQELVEEVKELKE